MLDIEELKKTKLGGFIKKSLRHKAPDPAFHAMLGHNPELSASMYFAWGTVFNTGKIDHKLKEIIRVQLSRTADCNYWGNVRSASAKQQGLTEQMIDEGIEHYETSDNFTASEKIALKFSDLMDTDPDKIDEAFYNQLKTHYSVWRWILTVGNNVNCLWGAHTQCIGCSAGVGAHIRPADHPDVEGGEVAQHPAPTLLPPGQLCLWVGAGGAG